MLEVIQQMANETGLATTDIAKTGSLIPRVV
jgi:hypothetical protein